MHFIDTESIGFYGATILFQYCKDDGPAIIHNVWENSVQSTLDLIEQQLDDTVVGFNLTHDWFHYSRTYNVLHSLPRNAPPDPVDYYDAERECLDKFCLKPKKACDLLLIGRRTKFQATLNQKPITMRKVPAVMADLLVEELKRRVPIPSIYFSKKEKGYEWRIIPLIKGTGEAATEPDDEIDPDFVNIKLDFAPSTSLKAVMAYLGHDVTTLDDLPHLRKTEEVGWYPSRGDWIDVFNEHAYAWKTDPRRIKYALNDPIYTRELWEYLDRPEGGDTDSELACAIGAMHWRGYSVDLQKCGKRYLEQKEIFDKAPINVNAPRQVKVWLGEVADAFEKQVLVNTSQEVLKKISDEWVEDNPILAQRAKLVLDARHARMEMQLLERLIEAKRMHVTYKVIGTKSNRMSGGSESSIKSNGSINPQGIKKGPGIRSCFTLAHKNLDEILCGGDFSGFEVSIAEAVYQDPVLREELLKGKKMHALFGAEMYGMTYEEVLATEELNINDPNGFYQRAKRGFFATLYGAEEDKLSQSMWLTAEQARAGLDRFFAKYKVIAAKRLAIKQKFTALSQPGDIGSKIVWQEPALYQESILGFRRYFDLEFSIIRCLYDIAQNPSEEFKELGKRVKVVRRDRIQTASGASLSAIYSVAFSLQGQVFRAAANHDMQSPGGEITKEVQAEIWKVQPIGINQWFVMPLNVHDEIEAPCHLSVVDEVKRRVDAKVLKYKEIIPLIKMDWKTHLPDWSAK